MPCIGLKKYWFPFKFRWKIKWFPLNFFWFWDLGIKINWFPFKFLWKSIDFLWNLFGALHQYKLVQNWYASLTRAQTSHDNPSVGSSNSFNKAENALGIFVIHAETWAGNSLVNKIPVNLRRQQDESNNVGHEKVILLRRG